LFALTLRSFDHFSLDYYAPQGKQYASGVVLLFNPSNKKFLPSNFLSIHNRQQQEINSVLGASVFVFLNKVCVYHIQGYCYEKNVMISNLE